MTEQELQKLKYPIGKFNCPRPITKQHLYDWISVLEHFPDKLEELVSNLTEEQLNTVYRPGGWTIRQVVHHLSDSHYHSYARFKWAMTEDKPLIKAYYEERWAALFDYETAPIEMSIQHLKAVHVKLVYFLKGLNETDFHKSFVHPETNSEIQLDYCLGSYAWHSNHHYAHIENVMKYHNWI